MLGVMLLELMVLIIIGEFVRRKKCKQGKRERGRGREPVSGLAYGLVEREILVASTYPIEKRSYDFGYYDRKIFRFF